MIALTCRWNDWLAGMAAGCERLVDPGATGVERTRHCRLLGVLLGAPFILSAAVAQGAWPVWGAAGVLALMCAVFGASWLVALLVASRGSLWHGASALALAGGALLVALISSLSGGPSAPSSLLLAAIVFEAWWVSRSRRAVWVAAIVTLSATIGFAHLANFAEMATISAWQWISPALYALTLGLRFLTPDAGLARVRQEVVAIPATCLDAVVVRLGRAGESEHVSPQAAAILGVDPELLLGGGLFERIHVADRVVFLCAAAKARDEDEPQRCDIRIRMPAGEYGAAITYRWFEVEIVATAPGSIVAIIRAGDEKAELRQALTEAREKAEIGEVTKGRFLATVSHELRTPLNAIIGFSDMLLHREISGDLAPKQAEQVGLIRDAGNHLLSVVNAILDVSKIESGSYDIAIEAFELTPAVELCCSMLEPQANERGVTLGTKLPLNLGEVMGDRRAIQQILINLLSNAIKFTPAGGRVTIDAACAGDVMRIVVNDTGIGIKDEDLARLGQPFVQVQNDYTRQFQGTGLGLSLVKGLVKLHGGSMTIESAPGLGTTVTVGLPAVARRNSAGPAPVVEVDTGERYDAALRKIA